MGHSEFLVSYQNFLWVLQNLLSNFLSRSCHFLQFDWEFSNSYFIIFTPTRGKEHIENFSCHWHKSVCAWLSWVQRNVRTWPNYTLKSSFKCAMKTHTVGRWGLCVCVFFFTVEMKDIQIASCYRVGITGCLILQGQFEEKCFINTIYLGLWFLTPLSS